MENKNNNDESQFTTQILNERITFIEEFLYRKGFQRGAVAVGLKRSRNEKCGSNMQKGELIYLFHILMEEGIWFFDPADKKKNRSQFQCFIEENFTYSGEGGIQHNIVDSSRHFSKCRGFTYRDKQVRYLEKIIAVLISKKEGLIIR